MIPEAEADSPVPAQTGNASLMAMKEEPEMNIAGRSAP